jgi:hypothetical protein
VRRRQHSGGHRQTIFDLRWPNTPEYTELARIWSEDTVNRMLTAVWCGYDTFCAEILDQINIAEADEERERAVTQALERCIRRHLSGNEPYTIQHGSYEYATRQPAPAQPPQYDAAFVFYQNQRLMWPLEAKFLRSDGAVADYIRDVQDEFLTGRYAPYANSGAMLGYLLSGSPATAFSNIEQALHCQLLSHPVFSTRQHRTSDHSRNLAQAEFMSGPFRCHHLIMEMRRNAHTGSPSRIGLRRRRSDRA